MLKLFKVHSNYLCKNKLATGTINAEFIPQEAKIS